MFPQRYNHRENAHKRRELLARKDAWKIDQMAIFRGSPSQWDVVSVVVKMKHMIKPHGGLVLVS